MPTRTAGIFFREKSEWVENSQATQNVPKAAFVISTAVLDKVHFVFGSAYEPAASNVWCLVTKTRKTNSPVFILFYYTFVRHNFWIYFTFWESSFLNMQLFSPLKWLRNHGVQKLNYSRNSQRKKWKNKKVNTSARFSLPEKVWPFFPTLICKYMMIEIKRAMGLELSRVKKYIYTL